MSDIENPYQSPAANTEVVKPLVSQGALTEIMVKNLIEASPWLRFIGVLGFIGSGFCFLAGIIFLFSAPFANQMFDEIPGYFSLVFRGLSSMIALYSLYFIGIGVVNFFPSLFAYRFGTKIRVYTQSNSEQDLEFAFRNNKSYWKFKGILAIIGLAVVPLFIIIGIVMVVAAIAMS